MSPITSLRVFLLVGLVLISAVVKLKGRPLEADLDHFKDLKRELFEDPQIRELLVALQDKRATPISVVGAKIEQLNDVFTRLVADKDIEGLKAMYDPEAIVISGGISIQGLQALSGTLAWVKAVDGVQVDSQVIVSLDSEAKFVFEKKVYTAYKNLKKVAGGRGLTIWKLTPDGYKMYVEVSVGLKL